jgi:ATP-dependent RNA helicase DDX5/DBP2
MALEETKEERAERKALKKESRNKDGKKVKKEEVTEEAEVPSKKRKAPDGEVVEKKSKASKETDDIPRRRTRSLSNAEEVYPEGATPEDFRKEHQLAITGNSDNGGAYVVPAPMTTFAMTPFSQPIRKALDNAGFPNPTPTQAQVWPIALAGRDVITVAKTGSGKIIYELSTKRLKKNCSYDEIKYSL